MSFLAQMILRTLVFAEFVTTIAALGALSARLGGETGVFLYIVLLLFAGHVYIKHSESQEQLIERILHASDNPDDSGTNEQARQVGQGRGEQDDDPDCAPVAVPDGFKVDPAFLGSVPTASGKGGQR